MAVLIRDFSDSIGQRQKRKGSSEKVGKGEDGTSEDVGGRND